MIRSFFRPHLHYGWVIVATGALTLFSCLGLARFAYGMLLPSMRDSLGFGYDQMGLVSTGNFIGYLVSVVVAPGLIRRYRPRAVIATGLLLIAVCMFAIGRCHSFGWLLALYCLTGIGSGLANIPVMVLVSHWFRRDRRGRAAGLMIAGNGSAIIASGYLVPALNQAFGADGWRVAWQLLAAVSLAAAVCAAAVLRNDPAELDLEPVGKAPPLNPDPSAAREPTHAGRILLHLGLLYTIFGITYMIFGTFIVSTMVEDFAFSEARAGRFWSSIGFFSVFSGVLFGTLSDRIGRKQGLLTVFAIQTVAYLLVGLRLGSAGLMIAMVLYGVSAFAIPTIMAAAVGDFLGLNRAAGAFATVTLFFAAGQVVGPGSAGLIAEASGSFSSCYLLSAALTGGAILLTLILPKPSLVE
ncbi:MAG: MFS transporter [Desulfuromonas sp.]|nr:MAG: MFS transporter [Desulfuromonas sp.]